MEDVRSLLIPHDYVVDEQGSVFPKGSGFGGKYTSLPAEYRKKLSAPIDKKAITKHPTKTFLSVIKAIYVAERLNDVFGIDGWNLEHEIVEKTTTSSRDGDVPYIVMKGRIYIRKYDLYTPYQYGGHQLGGKGTEPADGYKSAVTDIQSKCASLLEVGIQVFKGDPFSQVANESKVDEEEKEGVKNLVEKAPAKKAPEKKAPAKKEEKKEPEVVEEVKEIASLEKSLESIKNYVDAESLKVDAQEMVFEATLDGLNEDEVATLKKAINNRYIELINAGNEK